MGGKDDEGGGGRMARRTIKYNQKKQFSLVEKNLILKFTLLLTFKLKGIACNSTWGNQDICI